MSPASMSRSTARRGCGRPRRGRPARGPSVRLTSKASAAPSRSPSAWSARPRVRCSVGRRVGFVALVAATISSARAGSPATRWHSARITSTSSTSSAAPIASNWARACRQELASALGVAAPHRDPTEVLGRGRDPVRVVRRAGDAQRVPEARTGFVEPTLVGQHLADVARGQRGFTALPVRSRMFRPRS